MSAQLPRLLDERYPVLADLFTRLGRADAPLVAATPDAFVSTLDDWLSPQDLRDASPEDHAWVLVRVGYLAGELFAAWGRGAWMVDANPESETFLRIVIGDFGPPVDPTLSIDPMAVAMNCLAESPGRSLRRLLDAMRDTYLRPHPNQPSP